MTGPVEPVADTEAVETISRADLGKAVRWAQYRDWSISDEEHEVVENLADDVWNALTLRPRLVPVENGLIRPVVSSSTREEGETDGTVRAVCSGGGPSREPGKVLIEFRVDEGTVRTLGSEWLLRPVAGASS